MAEIEPNDDVCPAFLRNLEGYSGKLVYYRGSNSPVTVWIRKSQTVTLEDVFASYRLLKNGGARFACYSP